MSKPTPPEPRDQRARAAIEQRLDVNVLVEAGAGSGKTESLARRMAGGVAAGRYRVEEIAAVTFTRKAAAELRARFQLELERRLREESDGARRAAILEALGHLERLFAGTIHAFCAHLLRERPVEAGVAPGFTELEEDEDAEVRARAWRDFLDRERAAGTPLLLELQAAGVGAADLDAALGRVSTFADVAFPPGDGQAPDPAPCWKALDKLWKALQAELPRTLDAASTCGVQRAARRFGRLYRVANRARAADLVALVECWKADMHLTMKWWSWGPGVQKGKRDAVLRLIGDFVSTTGEPFLRQWRAYVYRLAMTLLIQGRDYAAEARRRALTLNYSDLLQIAARLLRDNGAVRAALQGKYRWLFVDEFQDTNPLQAEVIFLLAAEPGDERDWRRVRLRPGALFVVGDPKQSIYRFSGADIDTYSRARALIEGAGGEVLPLTTSFRAVPSLCRWANGVFRTLFPATADRYQPGFQSLDDYRPAPASRARSLRALTTADTTPPAKVAAASADAIARFIRAEVDAGRRAWGDFLILTRRKRDLGAYTAALDALHVPVSVSGSVAFSRSREVQILAGLLRALADPDDAVALVGVLRGPLFGSSDAALYAHRAAGHGFLLNAPLPEDASGAVVDALRALQAMYRSTRMLPPAAAVERLLETTGLLARAVAATPGAAQAGDLLHAVDRVRQIAESGGGLAQAAAALERDLDAPEVESVPLEPGRQNVVRVMNLHKAKGLEAPVVFLADPLGGVKERADIRIDRSGAVPLGWLHLADEYRTLAEPADWDQHEAEELQYLRAEEIRLLYVAATRARDMLVVSRYAGRPGNRTLPWARLDLTEAAELAVPGAVIPPAAALGDLGAAVRTTAEAARTARREAAAVASWRVESVTGTAHRAERVGRPLQPGRTREPDTGIAWGTLIHGLLEHAMRGPHRDRAHLARLARWLAFGKPELQRVLDEAVDTVEAVMASEFWQRAQAAEERQVEMPCAVRIAGDPPRVLFGVIDLAFRDAAGWHVIDYKTDQATVDQLAAMYREQVVRYAELLGELTRQPTAYTGLYSVREKMLSANLMGARAIS